MEETDPSELTSREPSVEDLVGLCRALNDRKARYLVIGGFAMRAAGYDRRTMDIDLLVDTSPENERRVLGALATLPDQAALELEAGEIEKYGVVRVADEIVVDLMKSAAGFRYAETVDAIILHTVDGVDIPFASPQLLWKMKVTTHREKDAPDLLFLRHLLQHP